MRIVSAQAAMLQQLRDVNALGEEKHTFLRYGLDQHDAVDIGVAPAFRSLRGKICKAVCEGRFDELEKIIAECDGKTVSASAALFPGGDDDPQFLAEKKREASAKKRQDEEEEEHAKLDSVFEPDAGDIDAERSAAKDASADLADYEDTPSVSADSESTGPVSDDTDEDDDEGELISADGVRSRVRVATDGTLRSSLAGGGVQSVRVPLARVCHACLALCSMSSSCVVALREK